MKLTGIIKLSHGKIEYLDNFLDQLRAVKSNPAYNDREAEITVNFNIRKAAHYRFKYYYGYVLPVIANNSFSGNIQKAHIEMKRKFSYINITDLEEIPEEHYPGIIIEFEYRGWGHERQAVGYIQGMRTMTDTEAREYILKVEAFIFEFLGQSIDGAGQPYRQRGEL